MFDQLQQLLDPIAFTIPIGENGFPIYWYGIIIAIGIGIGTWWSSREIERRGHSADELFNGLLVAVISGYIAARFGYVLQDILAGAVYETFWDMANIRAGGVNILWGFIGSAIATTWFVRWRGLDFWNYADMAGPAIFLAQGIGRWGNFINQELYGPPTTAPWGLLIDARHRIAPYNDLATYPLETRFHPTFLYESIALLIGFAIMVFLANRYRETLRPGTLFGFFMLWWGGNRAWIELFRPDQPNVGNTPLTWSMLIAIGIALAGLYVLLTLYEKIPQSERSRRNDLRKKRTPKPKRQRDV